jgi:hypothetical protein
MASQAGGGGAPVSHEALVATLNNPELVALFWEALQSQCCEENLAFYLAVEQYKASTSTTERRTKALDIWKTHLTHDATQALNVADDVKRMCQESLFINNNHNGTASDSNDAQGFQQISLTSDPPTPSPNTTTDPLSLDNIYQQLDINVFDTLQAHCVTQLARDFHHFAECDSYKHYMQARASSGNNNNNNINNNNNNNQNNRTTMSIMADASTASSGSSSATPDVSGVLLASLDPNVSLFVPRTITLKDPKSKQPYTVCTIVAVLVVSPTSAYLVLIDELVGGWL